VTAPGCRRLAFSVLLVSCSDDDPFVRPLPSGIVEL